MTANTSPTLASLNFVPYLDDQGLLSEQFEGKVGIYAIFDQDKVLQFVGYSRDISLSLKQHLVRQPQRCYWVKVQTIERPSRAVLEGIRDAWMVENGGMPAGNGSDEPLWNQPIDAKARMTDAEKAAYEGTDEAGRIKVLKKVARRVEEEVLAVMQTRGVQIPIRFDPKLKEEGLLNLK